MVRSESDAEPTEPPVRGNAKKMLTMLHNTAIAKSSAIAWTRKLGCLELLIKKHGAG